MSNIGEKAEFNYEDIPFMTDEDIRISVNNFFDEITPVIEKVDQIIFRFCCIIYTFLNFLCPSTLIFSHLIRRLRKIPFCIFNFKETSNRLKAVAIAFPAVNTDNGDHRYFKKLTIMSPIAKTDKIVPKINFLLRCLLVLRKLAIVKVN